MNEEKMLLSDGEWKKRLSPDEYHVLRDGGTEPAFTGKYYDSKKKGTYLCKGCSLALFSSEEKYDSGTGWPSFHTPVEQDNLLLKSDTSHFMKRTEVRCNRCECHLGHVFDDGPLPSKKRYCINSLALELSPE